MRGESRQFWRLAVALVPLLAVTACDGSLLTPTAGSAASSAASGSTGTSGTTGSTGSTGTTGSSGSSGSGSTSQNFEASVTGLASGGSFQWSLTYSGTPSGSGTLSANGTTLLTGPALPSQDTYAFAVTSQPAGQTCSITNGSGSVSSGSVPPTVIFSCLASSSPSAIRGVATPVVRKGAVSWVQPDGTLSLFGGDSVDSSGAVHTLNDLWRFTPVTRAWSRVEPTTAAPPARSFAAAATDVQGNTWVFGGRNTNNGTPQIYGDLWRYDSNAQSWVCESGCGRDPSAAATSAAPPAREAASLWIDAAGNVWVSGGARTTATGALPLGDLWRYSPSTHGWTDLSNLTAASAQ
jgi:hypothetical protein